MPATADAAPGRETPHTRPGATATRTPAGSVLFVLTVSTVNVNGLRAAAKKGFVEWLAATKADVVACQEVRATAEQLPTGVVDPDGWFAAHAPSAAKGRNGVAVYSRVEPDAVRVGFGEPEFEDSGRYLEVHLPKVVVASLYLPSGDVGTERQDEKERFMAAFLPYLVELRAKAAADGREVVVVGDWNIAYDNADLKNWRGNRKSSGFLPEEREWLGRVYTEAGLRRRPAAPRSRRPRALHLVVLPRPGLRQRLRLAHRLPARHPRARREGRVRRRRARRRLRPALVRPRARHRHLRHLGRAGRAPGFAVHEVVVEPLLRRQDLRR